MHRPCRGRYSPPAFQRQLFQLSVESSPADRISSIKERRFFSIKYSNFTSRGKIHSYGLFILIFFYSFRLLILFLLKFLLEIRLFFSSRITDCIYIILVIDTENTKNLIYLNCTRQNVKFLFEIFLCQRRTKF